jgi:hypothetical protein
MEDTISPPSEPGVAAPARAVGAWVERGDPGPLGRWLDRELDQQGVPRSWPVEAWWPALVSLAEARRRREGGWPRALDERIGGLFRAALRFSRPGGAAVFGPDRPGPSRTDLLRFWADRLGDPGLARVVRWWFPSRSGRVRVAAAPPLPAFASEERPLAVLRPDWSARGDLLAVDGRDRGGPCRLELLGRGARLLGPAWASGAAGPAGAVRPSFWTTGAHADLAEWVFRVGPSRVTRTALLLRGRNLAMLSDQVDGPDPEASLRVALPPAVTARPVADRRALALSSARGGSARIIPLALPALPYPTERGSLSVQGGEIVLRQRKPGRRCWLPLLVSWRPERNRKAVRWRPLTVSERSKVCPPDVAFAARVAWGDEALVFYWSLGRPASRAFLGYQTDAQFLVGLFTTTGSVQPLLQVTVE